MTRSRRCLYIVRTKGNSAHTSAGGGGHIDECRAPVPRATCDATGTEVGQGERRGTSGEVVQKRKGMSGDVFAVMSENGIRGRLHQQNHNPTRATRLVALVALVALGFRLDPERLGLDLVRATRGRRSSFLTRSRVFHYT